MLLFFLNKTFIWISLSTFLSYSLCNSVASVQTLTLSHDASSSSHQVLRVSDSFSSMWTETLAEWKNMLKCIDDEFMSFKRLPSASEKKKTTTQKPVVGTEPSKVSILVLFLTAQLFLRLTSRTLSGRSNIMNVLD